jgi:hypothetical protein
MEWYALLEVVVSALSKLIILALAEAAGMKFNDCILLGMIDVRSTNALTARRNDVMHDDTYKTERSFQRSTSSSSAKSDDLLDSESDRTRASQKYNLI